MRVEEEKLETGKRIYRHFSKTGELIRVVQRYGTRIAHLVSFGAESGVEETFMVDGKLVSAEQYAAALEPFVDMPRPGATLVSKSLLPDSERRLARERWVRALDAHVMDSQLGLELDEICFELAIGNPRIEPGFGVAATDVMLGSKSSTESKAILERLAQAGAVAFFLPLDEASPAGVRSCSNLICELPHDDVARRRLLLECDLLSRENGEHGYFDNGQRFTLVRFP